MTIQYSTAVRNALLDSIETTIGASPLLRIYSGAKPADCATALSGNTLLAEIALPSDWLDAAAGGVKSKAGTWSVEDAVAAGTASFYRIYDGAGSTCHEQGSITITGGGGDMIVDNTSIATGQQIVVTTYTRTAPNA